MNTATSIVLVLLTGLAGFWKAIPVGIALHLHWTILAVAAAAGSLISLLILFNSGLKLKSFILAKMKKGRMEKKADKARKLFDAYGVLGLSGMGTLLLGPHLTLLLGLGVTHAHKKLLFYIVCSTFFWSAVITGLSVMGFDYVLSLI